MPFTYEQIARAIDHALLAPNLTVAELEEGIARARDYGVASVCIMPYYVRRCAELLAGSTTVASTTVGFPHGVQTTEVKLAEAEQALRAGARELDMVVNISRVVSGHWDAVREEVEQIVGRAHAAEGKCKVIFETAYLKDEQKDRLCAICCDVGADWVKTSTGFGPGGATIEDVRRMRSECGDRVQVKASGGIRTLDDLLSYLRLGATRIGCSRTFAILDEARAQGYC